MPFGVLLLTHLHSISAGPEHIDYKNIDVFSSTTGAWTTAQLSVARGFASATSVGNLAMFAGGYSSCPTRPVVPGCTSALLL